MAIHRDPNAPATVRDVERVIATMAELLFDLQRSVCAAVPIALREALGADVDAARLCATLCIVATGSSAHRERLVPSAVVCPFAL